MKSIIVLLCLGLSVNALASSKTGKKRSTVEYTEEFPMPEAKVKSVDDFGTASFKSKDVNLPAILGYGCKQASCFEAAFDIYSGQISQIDTVRLICGSAGGNLYRCYTSYISFVAAGEDTMKGWLATLQIACDNHDNNADKLACYEESTRKLPVTELRDINKACGVDNLNCYQSEISGLAARL